ncbi:hypothetical protein NDU88_000124 [Pleurodeles waltl]|uniref:Secreted protein n=1 Tax=Pleurodeles waltl TaxID=8319 RepID=A0AAV7N734_PLEWA|nr:hypothetical protein NDU88_000124 [Pleurodeles waltl]
MTWDLRLVMTGFGAGRVLSVGASVRCYRSPHTMQRPGTAAGDDWFWGGRVLSGGASVRCYRSPHTMQRPGTAAGDDWFWGW